MSDSPSNDASWIEEEDLGGSLFFLLIAINIFACGCAYNYFYGNRCGLNHRRYYDNRDGGGGGNATTNNNDPPGASPQDAVGGVGLGGMTLEDRKEFVANALKTEKFVPDASHAASNRNSASSNTSNPFASSPEYQQQQSTSDPKVAQSATCMDVEAQRNENAGGGARFICTHQQEEDEEDLDAHQQCAICIEKFHPGEEICRSHNRDCPHVFHRSCISSWLLSHEDCPCCRRKYLDFESDNEHHDDGNNAAASV